MKRFALSMLMTLTLVVGMTGCLSGNAKNQEVTATDDQDNVIKVVSTIFPPYDWVREVVGDDTSHVELTLLLDNGVDLHSYQPTAQDMTTIAESDLFIYVGGESDTWVDQALSAVPDSTTKVINLMEIMGKDAKEEEVVEGMQEEEHDHDHEDSDHEEDDHDHEDSDHEHEDSDHEAELDEHVWLSLRNAEEFTDAIAAALGELDAGHQKTYQENAKAFNERLAKLDKKYQEAVDGAPNKTVLFGDRFPFRYLIDDYGLNYYAAFVGCSAETEASFETVAFLADKVDALQLPSIYVIENSDKSIANTVLDSAKEKGVEIRTMNSMQSVTKKDIEEGASYIQIMEENLVQLEKGLYGE